MEHREFSEEEIKLFKEAFSLFDKGTLYKSIKHYYKSQFIIYILKRW